jgi:hypothetical protein
VEVLKAIQKAKDVKSKLSNTEKKVRILRIQLRMALFLGKLSHGIPRGSLSISARARPYPCLWNLRLGVLWCSNNGAFYVRPVSSSWASLAEAGLFFPLFPLLG